jgi:HK97 family phage prohead protease
MIRRFAENKELKASVDSDGKLRYIESYAALFNVLSTDLGGFKEKIEPGFFKNVTTNNVVGLFNHDSNYILASTENNTLEIIEDEIGLKYKIEFPQTRTIQDLVVSPIERGDLTGSSFGFDLDYDKTEYDEGSNVVTLLEGGAERLYDVGPVTFPAYPKTSEIGLQIRSIHVQKNKKIQENKKRYNQLIYKFINNVRG